ncbi:MFS transporter [Sinisalibacter aestuarii]|uniref:MFS transporter n=1 Tax=Sinisalibacter aestuarii TaxID=2949426 RepID=A0ABQ5LX19_9RHOB|nr:MFS transporter [Sinisalibacter aestuarii]GKY88945.1 MFS transporter [Sinisalibacter aestuarii]
MSVLEAARITRAPMLTLAAVGIHWGGLASLMPDLKAMVSASDAELGGALLAPAVGSMITMGLAPRIGRALGGWALPLAGLGIALALFLPLFAASPLGLGIALFFAGGAVALADMTANVRIAQLEARAGKHLQSVNHAVFSLFFGLTAFGVAFARQAGYGPGDVLPVLSVFALVVVLFGWDRSVLPPVDDPEDAARASTPPWAVVVLGGLILFAGFIGENATEAWSALHIERTLGGAPGEGSFGPATLGFVMFLGRLAGQVVASAAGEARLILGSAVLGSIGAVIIATAPTQGVVILGVAVLGLGMAVIVPATNSIIGRLVSDAARPAAISRTWMAGLLGFFIGPSMMGGLAEIWNLRVSFGAVAVIVALIIPAVLALSRRG